jgi:chemotaxis protein CheX
MSTVAALDLTAIVSEIWTSMLGMELVEDRDAELEGETLTGCVQITGPWEGAVTVQLDAALATRVTGVMFGMEPDVIVDEYVSDAVGELANVAGGNVKALLEPGCSLSLPSVTRGTDYRVYVPGAETVERSVLRCASGGLVVVSMLTRTS